MADEGKTELKIDFIIQGIPHVAVEQWDDRTREIRRLVPQVKNLPEKRNINRRLAEQLHVHSFQWKPKKIIHNMENVECFELCAILPRPTGTLKHNASTAKRGIVSRKLSGMASIDGMKMPADVWTRSRVRNSLSLPRGTSGNGTKTTGSLPQMHKARIALMTVRPDYSAAIKAINDFRQKDEQKTNHSISPSHQTRQRPLQKRQWQWISWSSPSSSSSEWKRSQTWWTQKVEGLSMFFFSYKSFAYRKWRFPCKRRVV